MTSHVPSRHHVAFGARASRKCEACIIIFNFGCFWDIFGLLRSGRVFPRNFLRSADVTCNIARPGCLAPFVLPRKAVEHPICSFLVKPKFASKRTCKCIHIFVPSHMTSFQWTPISLGGITWCSELGPRESPKAYIIHSILAVFGTF